MIALLLVFTALTLAIDGVEKGGLEKGHLKITDPIVIFGLDSIKRKYANQAANDILSWKLESVIKQTVEGEMYYLKYRITLGKVILHCKVSVVSEPWLDKDDQMKITEDPSCSVGKLTKRDSPRVPPTPSLPEDIQCASTEQKCANNIECVEKEYICDGDDDCDDNSDEKGCETHQCHKDYQKCADNTHCVHKELICDGLDDCNDTSDEQGCETRQCPEGYQKCADNTQCVDKGYICDGIDGDCDDESDEKGCVSKRMADGFTKANISNMHVKYVMYQALYRDDSLFNSTWFKRPVLDADASVTRNDHGHRYKFYNIDLVDTNCSISEAKRITVCLPQPHGEVVTCNFTVVDERPYFLLNYYRLEGIPDCVPQ